MAKANPSVDQFIDDYDLEPISVVDPHLQEDFDRWLIRHSTEQLLNKHSSIALRWQVIHWAFTIPLVSKTYADPLLRSKLDSAATRFKDSVHGDSDQIDTATVYSSEVPSLQLTHVAFSLTEEFTVIPHAYSFEAVCMRLQLDPEVACQHIEYEMRRCGITQLIEMNSMAVASKCDVPDAEQLGLLGPVDWSDISTLTQPVTVSWLCRSRPVKKVYDQSKFVDSPRLFSEAELESLMLSNTGS